VREYWKLGLGLEVMALEPKNQKVGAPAGYCRLIVCVADIVLERSHFGHNCPCSLCEAQQSSRPRQFRQSGNLLDKVDDFRRPLPVYTVLDSIKNGS
jgi:hypothetical protein